MYNNFSIKITTMDPFEQSIINFARLESLNDLRRNGTYDFRHHSIPVTCIHNNGVIKDWGYNKCFFISLSQGIKKLYNLSPVHIMNMIGFTDRENIFDTDEPSHVESIQLLVDILIDIQIHIFVGTFDSDTHTWYTTQDYAHKYGSGRNIIRILNKGDHFELITTPGERFVRDTRTMTNKIATTNQHVIMKLYNIKNRKF